MENAPAVEKLNEAISINLLDATAKIVCATAENLRMSGNPKDEMPAYIKSVYTALSEAVFGASVAKPVEKKSPAVPVGKSVYPDYIICLEDGKKFKSLKRHLSSTFSLTPDQYRAKWNLPSNYPMVAPNYAETRSKLAKESGLGKKRAA